MIKSLRKNKKAPSLVPNPMGVIGIALASVAIGKTAMGFKISVDCSIDLKSKPKNKALFRLHKKLKASGLKIILTSLSQLPTNFLNETNFSFSISFEFKRMIKKIRAPAITIKTEA